MKKTILLLGFLLLISIPAFAEDDTEEETPLPKNIITIDIGPAAHTFSFIVIRYLLTLGLLEPMYAFGIAAQYERQITEKVSAAGRFEYSTYNVPGDDPKWMTSVISAEAHGRYYPFAGIFFLGGALGYTYIFTDFSTLDREIKPSAHYLKLGGKLGWRIDFDKPGGFIFEPSVGIFGSFGTKLDAGYGEPILGSMLDFLGNTIAKALFLDGFRFSLALGCRW
jgi:hypothetical protein